MRPSKIISGGQTGADQAGLKAAKSLGISTGGTAPRGYKTDDGPSPWLKEYGLAEDLSSSYVPRTKANIMNSDGTAIFGNPRSPGSKLTADTCIKANKPLIINPKPVELRRFVGEHKIQVLNIAGNRERTNPGIGNKVYQIVRTAFKK